MREARTGRCPWCWWWLIAFFPIPLPAHHPKPYLATSHFALISSPLGPRQTARQFPPQESYRNLPPWKLIFLSCLDSFNIPNAIHPHQLVPNYRVGQLVPSFVEGQSSGPSCLRSLLPLGLEHRVRLISDLEISHQPQIGVKPNWENHSWSWFRSQSLFLSRSQSFRPAAGIGREALVTNNYVQSICPPVQILITRWARPSYTQTQWSGPPTWGSVAKWYIGSGADLHQHQVLTFDRNKRSKRYQCQKECIGLFLR